VGAVALEKLASYLGTHHVSFEILNKDTSTPEKLNHECGADFVKIKQTKPVGFDLKPGYRCASLDGDADRIVFYYTDGNSFKLLDGDKIATLAAAFFIQYVREANLNLAVGIVQTAYANGSSTAYAKEELGIPVVFTPTGVKHLHHAAEAFDIGVYFEANGHGTVLFSSKAIQLFNTSKGSTENESKALKILRSMYNLINQTVGDALSDLLMVEAILMMKQMSFEIWDSAYTDLPSKQEKVKVADRNIFVPINADTELAEPADLQGKINAVVKKFNKGRSFVRPSGTEDVVRVYAEAATTEETAKLSSIICGIVFDSYGGVGPRPQHFASEK
jgi:phosphoacetylglucosamine mutase